jgi:hypothetical protein
MRHENAADGTRRSGKKIYSVKIDKKSQFILKNDKKFSGYAIEVLLPTHLIIFITKKV